MQFGFCCWKAPGELNAEDLDRLSKHFGLTPQEFFKRYTIVDKSTVVTDYMLRLKRTHWDGGRMTTCEETFEVNTPCVFLDVDNGNKCKVHEVKPAVCAHFQCWNKLKELDIPNWTREQLTALGWDGVDPDEDALDNWGDDHYGTE